MILTTYAEAFAAMGPEEVQRLRALADQPISKGDDNTLSTLLFAAAYALEFICQPETWPVFAGWYQHHPLRPDRDAVPAEAREEMLDMMGRARLISMAEVAL